MPEIEVVVRIFVLPYEITPDKTAEQVAEDYVREYLDPLAVEVVDSYAVKG